MKKNIWKILGALGSLGTLVLGILGLKKRRKQKKENQEIMKDLQKKQELLMAACEEKSVQYEEILAIVKELESQMGIDEDGIDPREINTKIDD